jgi:hypothetical protein
LGVNELGGVGHADGIFSKRSTCQLSAFVLPSHKTVTICCTGNGLMMVPSMRRLWSPRLAFSPCDVASWLNFTLASLRIHLTSTGMSCQVAAYCACAILRCTFWRSLDSSQLIPASRMRSTIAIAVRHRSNSSFCCALKASSGLAGLGIYWMASRTPLPVSAGARSRLSATDAP